MIKLLQSASAQQVSFIPRSMDAYSITLRNESTQVETVILPSFFKNEYYLTATTVFTLVENHFYNFTVKDISGNIIYLDKIFCTNQTADDYTINNGAYINAAASDTIFYE
jgi:hypothetical protein